MRSFLERLSVLCGIALLALAPACRSQRQRAAARGTESAASAAAVAAPTLDVLCAPSVETAIRKAGEGFRASTSANVRVAVATPAQIRARLGAAPSVDVVVLEGELADAPGIVAGSARRIGQSALVLVRSRRADEIKQPDELPKASFPHFVLPDPVHNPSGAAAKAWLAQTKAGSTSLLEALEPRLLPEPDARATLAELERRGRTMGVVLKIDLTAAKTIKPFFELPTPPIPFTAAVVRGPNEKRAAAFVKTLAEKGIAAP
jgi:hypothetical protein